MFNLSDFKKNIDEWDLFWVHLSNVGLKVQNIDPKAL